MFTKYTCTASDFRTKGICTQCQLVCCLFAFVLVSSCAIAPEFDDQILHQISWRIDLPNEKDYLQTILPERIVEISTQESELYTCVMPDIVQQQKGDEETSFTYSGPTISELMEDLFEQNSCSYRLEQYWMYELCHGRYLRQYHEEKETAIKSSFQEFFLGRFDRNDDGDYSELFKEPSILPIKRIGNAEYRYIHYNMTNGTKCDLTGLPRRMVVYYVCNDGSRNEITYLKEASTCEYEVVISTSFLCGHPLFKPKEIKIRDIECYAKEGSPRSPKSLEHITPQPLKYSDAYNRQKGQDTGDLAHDKGKSATSVVSDKELIRNFLKGEYCLSGGRSWWRYEFCYGKHVYQFHEEKGKDRINILLGVWNEKLHVNWLKKNSHKRPSVSAKPKQVSHFFFGGDVCDLTGKPRMVEVKLKCKENAQTEAVSLYLIEPKPCEYILGIETSIICPLMQHADQNGLFPVDI